MSQLRKVIEARLNAGSIASALGTTTLNGGATTKSIFYDHLPALAAVVYPLIVFWTVSGNPKATSLGRIEDERWQIDINARTLDSMESLVELVKNSLDKWSYSGADYIAYKFKYDGTQKPVWDDDLKLWSQSIDFLIAYQKQ
jgi:hypothetical protein